MNPNPTQQSEVYISFSAEINPNTSETLIASVANAVNHGVRKITLLIATPGGNVMNGLNVYNVLKGMPVELITHNVGNVDSIGNAIFLAGSKRYACAHSTFMFHGVSWTSVGSTNLGEKQIGEILDAIRSDQWKIGSVIKDRTLLDEEAIAGLFLEARLGMRNTLSAMESSMRLEMSRFRLAFP